MAEEHEGKVAESGQGGNGKGLTASALDHRGWGLLWLDRECEGIEKTLPRAIARFKTKFGHSPVVVYLSEGAIAQEYAIGKLRVVPVRNCPPRHAMLFQE